MNSKKHLVFFHYFNSQLNKILFHHSDRQIKTLNIDQKNLRRTFARSEHIKAVPHMYVYRHKFIWCADSEAKPAISRRDTQSLARRWRYARDKSACL